MTQNPERFASGAFIYSEAKGLIELSKEAQSILGLIETQEVPLDIFLNLFPDSKQIVLDGLRSSDLTFDVSSTKGTLRINVSRFEAENNCRLGIISTSQIDETQEEINLIMDLGNLAWWKMELPSGKVEFGEKKVTMIGYTMEEFKDAHYQNFTSLLHPDDYRRVMLVMKDYIDGKSSQYNVTYRIKAKDGSWRWYHDIGITLEKHPDGTAKVIKGIVIDETEKVLLDQEKERLYNDLEAKNAELESMIYIASHDLRSPLVNIAGFGKKLESDFNALNNILHRITLDENTRNEISSVTESVPTSLGFLLSSSDKMNLLINGILKISRAGRGTVNKTRVNVTTLINNILDSLRYQINESKTKVVMQDIPDCDADEQLLNQVFTNLIDNAIKYRDINRENIITITGGIEGGNITYKVEDNGIGIKPEAIQKLGELFYRTDTTTKVKGDGVGLTVVKRIMGRLKGNFWCESEFGKGSKFYISLPV